VVEYRVTRRRGQKHLYLRIDAKGRVKVSAPAGMNEAEIANFVARKAAWIAKCLAHRSRYARPEPDAYADGVRLWYLGVSYPVRMYQAAQNRLSFEKERFVFACRDEAGFVPALRRWYAREARRLIVPRVEEWSRRMGLEPSDILFRRYKARWGCCDAQNRLSFNTALVRYDWALIDYVIVHELAHIRHKNHAKAFWELVASFVPDYKALRHRLV